MAVTIHPVPVAPAVLEPADYGALHAGCLTAIEEEIAAVRSRITEWGGDKPARVLSGTLDGIEGDSYVYEFRLASPMRPPEFTGVDITIRNTTLKGHVEQVSEDGLLLTVGTEEPLPPNLHDASLSFDPTEILRSMHGRLLELGPTSTHPNIAVVHRAVGLAPSVTKSAPATHESIARRDLNDGQAEAIGRAAHSEICLVFGPPGTGKTRTLGSLVAELETQGKRVLVTAHTNTALDTAMASVVDAMQHHAVAAGKIVRMGKISKEYKYLGISQRDIASTGAAAESVQQTQEIAALEREANALLGTPPSSGWGLLRKPRPGLSASEAKLSGLLRRLVDVPMATGRRPEVQDLRAKVVALQMADKRNAANVALGARVVGATLSKIALKPEDLGEFDTVVVDEASMAMLPQVMIAAGLAKQQVIALGDPRQLPPVVQSDGRAASDYLKRNLYRQLQLHDPSIDDPRRPILTVQYRMAPQIRALVSGTFYADRLTDDPRIAAATYDGGHLVLVDSSEAVYEGQGVAGIERRRIESERKGSSRVNEGHAALIVDIIRKLRDSGETDIGVITPFAAQSKVLRNAITQNVSGFFRMGGFIRTIHRSQGGEKNVIILDTVDAPPQASSFLDDRWNKDLPQLMCVALSRARQRLIIVAHTQALRDKYQQRGALIMRVLERAYREGQYIRPKDEGIRADFMDQIRGTAAPSLFEGPRPTTRQPGR